MAGVFASEVERRGYAVRRVRDEAIPIADAASEVGRSRQWLHKWLARYDADGLSGLADLSRAPHRSPAATSGVVIERILEVRGQLETHPFANRGAEAIRYEMLTAGDRAVPSESTIERVLARHGRTGPATKTARTVESRPLPTVTAPGVWQQIDWVGPRWLARRVRFSSLHLIDVGSGGAAASQYPDEKLAHTPHFLTEVAWPHLSIPLHLQTDGAFIAQPPGHDPRPFNTFVRCCLFFGTEVIISPPEELGWQNWVESFNGLWQQRTIRRHTYRTVTDVAADSDRFINYYMWHKPHPRLTVTSHGTRFPGHYIAGHIDQLRYPPDGFSITDHTDRNGRIRIPLARGRLTYLRRVLPGGVIEISRSHYPLPTTSLTGQLVVATVLTGSRRLVIRYHGETIATHPFPIPEPPIDPYHPIARRSLYHTPASTMS
jgi:hypothetical protein